MNVLYSVTRCLLNPTKVPYILCSSVRLKNSSGSLLSSPKVDSPFDANAVKRKFEGLTLQTHECGTESRGDELSVRETDQEKGNSVNLRDQKILKRKGFDALTRWCSVHQETVASCTGFSGLDLPILEALKDIHMVDVAAIKWLQSCMSTFSCGQSLVIVSLLCDILYQKARLFSLTSGKKRGEHDECNTPNDQEGIVEQSLISTILAFKHSVSLSEHLGHQPLVLLLSAVYGLHRISAENFPLFGSFDALERSVMEVPEIFFPIVFRQMQEAISSTESVQTQCVDPDLSIEMLLTFLLVFTPERRAEFRSQMEQKVFSKAMDLLQRKIKPYLKNNEEIDTLTAAEEFLGDKEGVEGGEKGVEFHEETPSPGETAATAPTASPLNCASINLISLQECAELMRNVRSDKPLHRLRLLEYVCCFLRSPSKFTLEEAQLLPGMFSSLENVEGSRGRWLTDYIIQQLPPLSVSVMASLLSYTRNPFTYLQRMKLTDDCTKCLRPDDAIKMLQVGSSFLPWNTQKQLILACLGEPDRAVIESLINSKVNACSESDRETTLGGTCQLTPRYIALLDFLILQKLSNMKSNPGEEGNREEVLYWASALMVSANWGKGIKSDQPQDLSDKPTASETTTTKENAKGSLNGICYSLKALEIYAAYRDLCKLMGEHLSEKVGCLPTLVLSDKTLLNRYVRYVFMSASRHEKEEVIAVLMSLIRCLDSKECKRQVVDRLIRYNTPSTHSLSRFIELLSEEATVLSVYNSDLTNLFLKQSHLDPRRLPGAGTYQVSGRKLDMTLHTVYLTRALGYLLGSNEWRVLTRAKEIRTAISSWVDYYFLMLVKERNEVELRQRGLVDDQEGILQHETVPLTASEETFTMTHAADTPHIHPADETSGDESGHIEDDLVGTSLAGEGLFSCGTKDSLPSRPPSALTSSISENDLEELLEVVYQTGCDTPPSMMQEVNHRCQLKLFGGSDVLANETGIGDPLNTPAPLIPSGGVSEQVDSLSCAASPHDEIGLAKPLQFSRATPTSGLVLPAHFLTLVRSELPVWLPLHRDYLEFLLRTCGLEIAGSVLAAFLMAHQQRHPQAGLVGVLGVVATAFEAVMKRLATADAEGSCDTPEAVGKKDSTKSASVVLAQLTRVAMMHLSKARQPAVGLDELLRKGVSDEDSQGEGNQRGEVLDEEGGEANGADVDNGWQKVPTDQKILKKELQRVEGLFLKVFSLLSDEMVKEVALQHLHFLHPILPGASEYLFTRAREQMSSFPQRSLILLASHYPPGADVVLRHMMRLDLRLTVDFGDFLKVAKSVPMQIVEKVTDAHLESLSFAWCTRLLSALVARQEEISDKFLSRILDHMMEINVVRDSDRNLFLFILQSYLPTPECPQKGSHFLHPSEGGSRSSVLLKPLQTQKNGGNTGFCCNEAQGSLPLIKHERCAREELIHKCLKSILSLENVTTIDSLIRFLENSLPIAQNLIELVVMERGERIISEHLLSKDMVDVVNFIKLVQLFQRHHLPIFRVGQIVKIHFFDSEDFLKRIAPCVLSEACPRVDEEHPWGTLTQATSIAHVVELAALVGGAKGGPCGQQKGDNHAEHVFLKDVMVTLRRHFQGPSEQLLMLSALVDTMARYDLFPVFQLDSFTQDLCETILMQSSRLSSSEFAKLLQNISRLKKWDVIKQADSRMGKTDGTETFDVIFCAAYKQADPHSRCVIVKAMCSEKDLFLKYEDYTMGFLRKDIHLLSHEDLEVLLVACLHMQNVAVIEETIDAIGTRLLGMLDQCKRSTLVRLLQCHANFAIPDDALLLRVLALLEEQFVSRGEARLENSQLLTLLQAIAQLDLPVPTRLVTLCFAKLEKQIDRLSHHQLAQAGLLAMDLEMGYSASIHTLVVRILESREGYRSSKFFREVSERLCDEYDVEVPVALRAAKLRVRRERERLEEYWHQRRLLAQN